MCCVLGARAAHNLKSDQKISDQLIRDELARILKSPMFAQSDRLGRFLSFTVEATLSGESDALKEYLIGTEVYDRKPPYHPNEDSIVRSEARRLRSKLKEYYEAAGDADPVFIYFRPGSYVPVFRLRSESPQAKSKINPADSSIYGAGSGVRVAVLPFVSVSRTALSDACAQAITDELTHELALTEGVRVTAATSVAAVNSSSDIPTIARRLEVEVLFEGTVRDSGNLLRITSRIVTADGFQVWSQQFDAEPDPDATFKLAKKMASALIGRVRPQLSLIRKRKATAGAAVYTVYPLVLSGEALLDEGTEAATRSALAKFQEALELEPLYARTLCGIAQCYCDLAAYGIPKSADSVAKSLETAEQAARLDPDLASLPATRAIALALSWKWADAEAQFQKALSLSGNAGTFRLYALYLAALKRFDESWDHIQQAQEIDPFSSRQKLVQARWFYLSRNFEEGIEFCTQRPVYGAPPVEARLALARMQNALGKHEDARRTAQALQKEFGAQHGVLSSVVEILAASGDAATAKRIAADMNFLATGAGASSPISKTRQSLLHLAFGESEAALDSLTAAAADHEAELVWLAADPRYDALRADPRFTRLEQKVNVP
jgi:TolB-like protein/Tfp pilus assembly protein PilF